MTNEEFAVLLDVRITKMRATLQLKGEEYASSYDRLSNFKQIAKILNQSPASALQGMMMKHLVSVLNIIRKGITDTKIIDEKIGDLINYLILLEAVLVEGDWDRNRQRVENNE